MVRRPFGLVLKIRPNGLVPRIGVICQPRFRRNARVCTGLLGELDSDPATGADVHPAQTETQSGRGMTMRLEVRIVRLKKMP